MPLSIVSIPLVLAQFVFDFICKLQVGINFFEKIKAFAFDRNTLLVTSNITLDLFIV